MKTKKDLKDQISEIENAAPQKIRIEKKNKSFELSLDKWLITNLSGNYGALFIRAILYQLNIDEFYVLKWRLENKYKQYEVLNFYIPNCMPSTIPFSSILYQKDGIKKISIFFSQGYFLKATLGDASGADQSWDKTNEFEQIASLSSVCTGQYENYMLQKKMHIKSEFRVHTFSKDIIPGLSYVTHGEKQNNYHMGIERFLSKILKKMPDSILIGTLIAWDIAFTTDNKYYIIETNFTGFHPEYRKGFQTSGYVDDHKYGPIICAWLNIYFKKYFGVYVDGVEENLFVNYPFYSAFLFYASIFKNKHINLVRNKTKQIPFSVIIYLGDDSNQLIMNLIKHFLLVDFATQYHVIVRDNAIQAVFRLFIYTRGLILLQAESDLFTNKQFELIKQLGYEKRKQTCCYHILRRLKDGIIL